MPDARSPGDQVERVFREVHGQAIATLVRIFGDISLAEDAVQDAFVTASVRWVDDGIPPNPAGWIITTARRRAIDVIRRDARGRELHRAAATDMAEATQSDTEPESPMDDDQLRLIFTCCHPALRPEHQVALTLRLLGGLGVDEIARGFLVGEAAMAKRLVRAKYKIKAANIPYRVPPDSDLPDRLKSVLAVIYLIYSTGSDGPGRDSLRGDAIRLGRSLAGLMPDEPEVAGLLALMLLNESRAAARGGDENIVLLRDQDRWRWDEALIDEGQAIVRACIRRDSPGPYQLQAAIQAVHSAASMYGDTDWDQIVTLYSQLHAMVPTPIVALNRAIAVGEASGAADALHLLEALGSELATYHLFHATLGDVLERLGRESEASAAWSQAAELAPNERDRAYLLQRASSAEAS